MTVPVRATAPAFGATVATTVPEPEPVAPAVIVIHGTLLAVGHVHPSGAVTEICTSPPAGGADATSGATVNVHDGGGGDGGGGWGGGGSGVGVGGCGVGVAVPACWTVACASPTVTLPTRTASPGFAVTMKWTVAFPVPLDGAIPPIQSALLLAVHWHPGVAVNANDTSVLAAFTAVLGGVSEYVHGAAAWTTSTDWFDTTTCARRDVPFGLGCTE